MKTAYRFFASVGLSALVSFSLILTTDAQQRSTSGSSSSGGSSRPSGNSAPASSAPRSTGNATVSRPQVNSGSGFRPTYGVPQQRNGFAPPQQRNGYSPQQRGYAPQQRGYVNPNNGYAPHVAVTGRTGIGAARPYVQGNVPSYNYGNRGAGASYRGYVGGLGNHGYYHYHGYYGTYYAPRLGFSVGFLPYGYYPFYWDDYQYFYSGGLYYQYENNAYTVVEPPIGAEITQLPSNAQSIVINGQQYYEANGVYYQPITKDDGTTSYIIAGKDGELNTTDPNGGNQQAPQIGDIVQSLPQDCRKIKLNNEKFYVSPDGYYYQDAVDASGNKVYKIVGTPNDEPQQ